MIACPIVYPQIINGEYPCGVTETAQDVYMRVTHCGKTFAGV